MRYCRYDDNRIGVVRDDGIHDVTAIIDELPSVQYPYPLGDQLVANLDRLRPKMEALADAATPIDPSNVKFLSPVANPTKIMGTPSNYQAHRDEADADAEIAAAGYKGKKIEDQGIFLKSCSALVGPSEGVAVRFPDRRTDHEAELGVIIGKGGSDIAEADVFDHIAGYALALDMVVRGPEDRSFRKSVDTYAVLGPWMVTRDEVPNPDNLDFTLRVNDEVRQSSNTSLMIIDIVRQVSWASTFYTLNPGDILMSGTCEGVSRVEPGDMMDFEFQDVGRMQIPIRAHEA